MTHLITSVSPGGPAQRAGILPGDRLVKINGRPIRDVLDYKYYAYDSRLLLELHRGERGVRLARLRKAEGEDPGLAFETFLMDAGRSCANKCVFCFVDQLPRGMRKSLYYKDDDVRLSFLDGNYVTLTNLTPDETRRIVDMRISPLNVSVHATEPGLRSFMLGNPRGGEGLTLLKRFARAGIVMNCQIVVCPGLNDSDALARTMTDLAALYPRVASVSVVPVGLTGHRAGLYPLTPFDAAAARGAAGQVKTFADACLRKHGSRVFFCADELYIKAGLPLPPDEYYEGYPQLHNGVGMLRLLITEFEAALARPLPASRAPFSVVTGQAAAPFMEKLLYTACKKYDIISGTVYAVRNDFFGGAVDVAGLVTGGDILAQLEGRLAGTRLLIPRNMLRHGETVFLDDVTVSALEARLGVTVRIVEQDGADLLSAMLGR